MNSVLHGVVHYEDPHGEILCGQMLGMVGRTFHSSLRCAFTEYVYEPSFVRCVECLKLLVQANGVLEERIKLG